MYQQIAVQHAPGEATPVTGVDEITPDEPSTTQQTSNKKRIGKMHLLQEALARARMRSLWRDERPHHRRASRQVMLDVRRHDRR